MLKIPLTRGAFAVVDDEFSHLAGFKWIAWVDKKDRSRIYAVRRESMTGKTIRMHSVICGVPADKMTDHINGDTLDNRRSNLRPVTPSQNTQNSARRSDNTSGRKGVCWHKTSRKWTAYLFHNGKQIRLGSHRDLETASLTYDCCAIAYFGVYARINLQA
jgi:hypothetical protein